MIKKILYVFILALMAQLIVACVNCNCPPIRTIYYTNKGISLKNMDSALPQPSVTNTGIIASTKYGIQIQLLTQQLTLSKPQISWGLMQSAYACKCPEDDFIAKEGILSLKVFSDQDFDSTHPKNTDLSLYFKAKRYDKLLPIIDYIKSSKDMGYISSYDFYEGIFLQVAPTVSKKHKFKIVITLSDGRTLEAETTEVELS
ncbi:DUF5034 domain-containing protein [Pedobacter frigidisoli]|uniref:DUF5034 domain-containing protein n=1 Tax=Pedobacter frigidisoli TaxID=2530455 RepID=A0A4R0P931_9SPHI|nr:DUF5034 domain-containing protein [Pedobacter frigidisoli]TCD12552.1 DUF5034 domain-containing protein [Pedobacter frigidisoli]